MMSPPDNLTLLTLIDALGYELHASNLVGNPCPAVAARWKRMSNPQPGDLVMETSTGPARLRAATGEWPLSPKYPHLHSEVGVGILLRTVQEPIQLEEGDEWNVEEDGPIPTERCWYLRRLDNGEEFRWVNADCVCILPREGWKWFSSADGGPRVLDGLFGEEAER